jgi:hypothetical protein
MSCVGRWSDPLDETTACFDRGWNEMTEARKQLSTCAIHRIITEGLLLGGVKKSGIMVARKHVIPTS